MNQPLVDLKIGSNEEKGYLPKEIPPFFLTRALAWFSLALFSVAISVVWAIYLGWGNGKSILVMGGVLFALATLKGIGMLYVAQSGKWFSLVLTCTEIEYIKKRQAVLNAINPLSPSDFRNSIRVSFVSESGSKVSFTFDRCRKFMIDSQYEFFFNLPSRGEEITIETLEKLKIDHAINPQTVFVE